MALRLPCMGSLVARRWLIVGAGDPKHPFRAPAAIPCGALKLPSPAIP